MAIALKNIGNELILPSTSVTDLAINSLTINSSSSGFVISNSGAISIGTIGINDVVTLQSKLSTIDISLNTTNTHLSAIDASLNTTSTHLSTIDVSLNALAGSMNGGSDDDSNYVSLDNTVGLMESLTTINVHNFAKNWSQFTNSSNANGVGIASSYNGQYILTLGWGASSYLSKDFGNTWNAVSALGSYQWAASMSANGKYILSTTIVGGSQLSSDYGVNWNYVSGVGTPNEGKVSPTGKYMVIASSTGIYYSSNFGQTFTNWTDSNTNTWNNVAISADGSTAVAVRATTPVTIWKTTNYGTSWSQIYSNPSSISFGAIACSFDAQYILVALSQGTSGQMYLSSDYGSTFSAFTSGNGLSSSYYFRVAMSANGLYMVAACNGGNVYYSIDSGATWSQSPLASSNYYGVAMSANANLVYAYIPGTKVFCFNANVTTLSTTQMNKPGQGGMYFDEASNKLYVYNSVSSAWKSVTLA
jgi:hypothetical protein